MEQRDASIIECAIGIISRYGYKKTTMADVAEAAGVSRQTLYNKFPNKEEVLRAAVRHTADVGLELLRQKWAAEADLAVKIDSFFEVGPLAWYDTLIAAPDAADLMEGVNAYAADVMEDVTRDWIALLGELFAPSADALAGKGTDPVQFGDFLYAASTSAKYNATSRGQLEMRLQVLKIAVLATVGE